MASGKVDSKECGRPGRGLPGCLLLALSLLPGWLAAQTYPSPLANTAVVAAPADVGDPTPGNNSATDSNAPALQAQLGITKTLLTATPAPAGGTVQYRIQVSNQGPSTAFGVGVVDSVPAQLGNVSWNCSAGTGASSCSAASGSGNAINMTVNVAVNDTVTLMVSGTAPTVTPATIAANTASLVLPPGTTDPTPGDNVATTPAIPVQPSALVANPDTIATPILPASGGTTTSVLGNDTLNGSPVVPANLLLSLVTAPTGYAINAAGQIIVPSGARAGAQQLTYQICESASPANCASTTASLVVAPLAVADSFNVNGGATTFNGTLAANDNIATSSVYTLTGAAITGLAIAPAGTFTYTPPGGINAPLDFTYQVCLPAPNGGVCSTATAHVNVNANQISATNDTFAAALSAAAGGSTATSVLVNDSYAGGAVPNGGQVQLTLQAPPPGFSITTTTGSSAYGAINVAAGTLAGAYTLTYRLCETAFPNNCATATARVRLAPDAQDDAFTTPGGGAALTAVVAGNDNVPAGAVFSTAAGGAPAHGGVVWNGNGGFTYTPTANFSGADSFTYQVCLPAPDDTVCDTATVSLSVGANIIDAVDDIFTTVIASSGGTSPSLITNDTLNGVQITPALATITLIGAPSGVQVGAGGVLVVSPGATAGAASFSYQLCQTGAAVPTCDVASVQMLIGPDALPDTFNAVGGVQTPGNVASNDNAAPGALYAQLTSPIHGSLVFNADGSFVYTPSAGIATTDSFDYQLCLPAPHAAVCDSTTVTFNVSVALIDARDDDFRGMPVAGGGSTTSVFDNDLLSNVAVDPARVSAVLVNGPPAGYSISATGVVGVPVGAAAGVVTLSYELCEAGTGNCDIAFITLVVEPSAAADTFSTVAGVALSGSVAVNDNAPAGSFFSIQGATPPGLVFNDNGSFDYTPANGFTDLVDFTYQVCLPAPDATVCSTATATITVAAGSIVAADDDFRAIVINPVTGGTTASVLANDSHNGAIPPAPAEVLLALLSAPPGFSINPNGTISVAGGSAAGAYDLEYSLCEAVLPSNCVTARVRLLLGPVAVSDAFSTRVGQALTGSVAANDSIATGSVFSVQGSAPNGLSLSDDGSFTFNPPTGTSGSIGFVYQLCLPAPDDAICSSASVVIHVNAGTLLAVDDDLRGTVIDPDIGGVTASVLVNDTLNGVTSPAASSVLLSLDASPAGYAINADGTIAVPAGAAAGAVDIGYRICEAALPANCTTAHATLLVAPAAHDDALSTPVGQPVAGALGSNDNAPLGAVYSVFGATPDGLALTADGGLIYSPPPGTSGAVSFTYQVCLPAPNASACDTATATIHVNAGTVLALPDDFTGAPVDPLAGGTTASVLGNDSLNGNLMPAPASVQLSLIGAPSGYAINADGSITVPVAAAAGASVLTYQLCEAALPGNCATAPVTLLVAPSASADAVATRAAIPVSGNVASNDNAPPGSNYSVTGTVPDGLVFAGDGSFSFTPPAGTSGTVGFDYQVCLPSPYAASCATAAVTITVTAGDVLATGDDFRATPINPVVGGQTTSVLVNDSFNAVSPPPAGSVLLSLDGAPAGFSIDAAGIIHVAAGTRAGAQLLQYRLCEAALPSNCVTAPAQLLLAPVAVDDVASVAVAQTLNGSVAGNDNVPADAVFTFTGSAVAGLTFNADGSFIYAPPAGTSGVVNFGYSVCLPAPDTSVCSQAAVTINVNAGTLVALPDDFSASVINPATGGTTLSVLANDSLNGSTAPAPALVQLSLIGAPTGYTIDADGRILVPAGAVAGALGLTYQVCEAALSSNCTTATVSLVLAPMAADDVVSTPVGQTINGNVALNDNAPVGALFAVSGVAPTGLTFNADGSFSFAPPAGSSGPVSFDYQVCLPAPYDGVCDTGSVTVNVNAGTLVASNDDFAAVVIDAAAGGTTASVLANDRLNGSTPPPPGTLLVSLVGAPASYAIDQDGIVQVAAGAPAGAHLLTYQVCEVALPSNCATAAVSLVLAPSANDDVASIPVGQVLGGNVAVNDNVPAGSLFTVSGAAPAGLVFAANGAFSYTPAPGSSGPVSFSYQVCLPAPNAAVCATATVTINVTVGSLTALQDDFSNEVIDPAVGGTTTGSVLGNDTLNGVVSPAPGLVVLSLPGAPAGYAINADGTIVIPANAAAGAVTLDYQICEQAAPTNCANAQVVLVVRPAAVDDVVSGPLGAPISGNVGSNDNAPATALYTVSGATPTGLVLNGDGSFTYTTQGTTGQVVFTYQVCLPAPNATVCGSASATINVNAGTLLAVADDFSGEVIDPAVGGTTAGSVLANDMLNGVASPAPALVTLSLVGAPAGYALNPDGTLAVTAGVAAGAISLDYQICEQAVPGNCSDARIELVVRPGAVDDVVSGPLGAPLGGNLAGNDNVPAGAVYTVSGVTPTGLVLNTDGSFSYTPQGITGQVVFTYQVCLPAPHDSVYGTASATININAGTLLAVADDFSNQVIDPAVGGTTTDSVLANDSLNGTTPPLSTDVTLSLVGAPAGYAINADGTLVIPAGAAAGVVALTYQVCELAAQPNCASATVALVLAPVAVDDQFTAASGATVNGNVGSNDNVPAGALFTVSGPTPPGLVLQANGSFVYTVPAGTTGPVSFTYQVCLPAPNDTVCVQGTATITVTAAAVQAVDDDFSATVINPATGGSTPSVLVNDRVNGVLSPPAASVLLSLDTAPPGVSIAGDGRIVIAAGTGAGALSITYRVCDAATGVDCGTATVQLTVAPSAVADIVSTPVGLQVDGNVGSNDNVPAGAVFSITGATPPGLTFNADGSFSYVPPGGTSGAVGFTYQVCLPAPQDAVCSGAAVTINVNAGTLLPVGDDFQGEHINPLVGGTTVGSVLANDGLNGATPTAPADVILSLVGAPSGYGITPQGAIVVPAGAAAGVVNLTYQSCERVLPDNCGSAAVSITVRPAAADDVASGPVGAPVTGNLAGNDNVPPGAVYSVSGATPAGLVLQSTGAFTYSPPAGTSGSIGFSYQVCLPAPNQTACDTASVTINLNAGTLTALGDDLRSAPIDPATGGTTTISVLDNDTLNGTTPPAPASVVLSLVGAPAGYAIAADGRLTIPAGASAGAVTLTYQICEQALPTNCASAQVSLAVRPGAANDVASGQAGTEITGNLAANDNVPPGAVYTVSGATLPGLVLQASGSFAYTPPVGTAGAVGFTYQVCLPAPDTTACSTASVTINVNAGSLTAVADDFRNAPVDPATGGTTTGSVLGNDTLNGVTPPLPTSVTLTLLGAPPGYVLHADGTLTIPPGAAAGAVTLTYQVCELALPTNCATATLRLAVSPGAVDDVASGPIGGTITGNLAGNDNVPPGSVYTVSGATPAGLVLQPSGAFTYSPPVGTSGPVGFTYQVCLPVPDQTVCGTASVTLNVNAGTLSAAVDDFRSEAIDPMTGGTTTGSVLANDSLNGSTPPLSTSVTLSLVGAPAGYTINADGTLSVAAGTAAGAVTLSYQVCEQALPGNCASAQVALAVRPGAVDDVVSGPVGGTITGNLAGNDNVPPGAIYSVSGATPAGLVLQSSGSFAYTAPAGITGQVSFTYQICLPTPDQTVCDTASVTLNLNAGTMQAAADDFRSTPIDAATGGTTIDSVLGNDSLAGATPTASTAQLSLVGAPSGYAINPDGTVTVPAGVAAGEITLTYQVCERAVPDNCASSQVRLLISPAPADDVIPAAIGVPVTGNLGTNDGVPPGARFRLMSSPVNGLVLNANGSFIYTAPAGAPAVVFFIYEVCLPAPNDTACSTAQVTLNVAGGVNVVEAVDDDFSATPISAATGGTTTQSVLGNDRFNGTTPPPPGSVTATLVGAPAGAQLNSQGQIQLAPGAAVGPLQLTYRLCEAGSTTNCSNATVNLLVQATLSGLAANADTPGPLPPLVGAPNLINVLDNDTFNGAALDPATVNFTSVPTSALTFDAAGWLTVAPNLVAGTYSTTYTICLINPPGDCSTATVTVVVGTPGVVAQDDDFRGQVFDPQTGGTTTQSVLDNDSLNGVAPPAPGTVLLTLVGAPAGYAIAATGQITVPAGAAAGAISLTYHGFAPKTEGFEWAAIVLSVMSCLCITKDEWVHAVHSSAAENWLHSLLFILHPVILIAAYGIWTTDVFFVRGLVFLSLGFFVYQILYWNFLRREQRN